MDLSQKTIIIAVIVCAVFLFFILRDEFTNKKKNNVEADIDADLTKIDVGLIVMKVYVDDGSDPIVQVIEGTRDQSADRVFERIIKHMNTNNFVPLFSHADPSRQYLLPTSSIDYVDTERFECYR